MYSCESNPSPQVKPRKRNAIVPIDAMIVRNLFMIAPPLRYQTTIHQMIAVNR